MPTIPELRRESLEDGQSGLQCKTPSKKASPTSNQKKEKENIYLFLPVWNWTQGLHVLSKCSTTWAIPPGFFSFSIFLLLKRLRQGLTTIFASPCQIYDPSASTSSPECWDYSHILPFLAYFLKHLVSMNIQMEIWHTLIQMCKMYWCWW